MGADSFLERSTKSKLRPATRRAIAKFTVLVLVDETILIPGTSEPQNSDRFVVASLKKLVKRVEVKEFTGAKSLLHDLDVIKPDVVFNMTQSAFDDRRKDAHICALLELQKIPYTGAGVRGLLLGRDKAISKLIAARAGFRAPAFFVVEPGPIRIPRDVKLPLIVKPRFGDASEGISKHSLVKTPQALRAQIARLRKQGIADIICEEFIEGREMFIGMVGSSMVRPKEFVFGEGSHAPRFATTTFKFDEKYRKRVKGKTKVAKLTPQELERLREICASAANALELGDYGRLDVRIGPDGDFYFLESNPNTGLAPPNTTWAGTWDPVDYDAMIGEITYRAYHRKR